MASIVDVFSKEDRVTLTVSQLMALIEDKTKVKAENDLIIKLACNGFSSIDIANLFKDESKQHM